MVLRQSGPMWVKPSRGPMFAGMKSTCETRISTSSLRASGCAIFSNCSRVSDSEVISVCSWGCKGRDPLLCPGGSVPAPRASANTPCVATLPSRAGDGEAPQFLGRMIVHETPKPSTARSVVFFTIICANRLSLLGTTLTICTGASSEIGGGTPERPSASQNLVFWGRARLRFLEAENHALAASLEVRIVGKRFFESLPHRGSTCGGFEDGERCALRIGQDGNAANIFKIFGQHIKFGAEIFCGRGRGVAIGNGKVWQPMSGSTSLVVGSGGNAANELLAVLDVPVIVGGIFVFLHHLPAKQIGIELSRARLIGSRQVGPAQCPVGGRDSGSEMVDGLPERKSRASGVL